MSPQDVMQVMQSGLEMIVIFVMVLLLPALCVGLVVSMFQAATQINEMTLSFIPKLLITLFTLALAGPWLLRMLLDYFRRLVENIPYMLG